jgi:hypothetical protein
VGVTVAALLDVEPAALDVPVPGVDEPAWGSLAWTSRACRRSDAAGSWRTRVQVRPKNATGTGSAGAVLLTGRVVPVPLAGPYR